MESYKILIKASAARELARGIPKQDLKRIVDRIGALAGEPRPSDCRKLSARNLYRIRQGDYRIVYLINDGERTFEIFKIGHRREIYRQA